MDDKQLIESLASSVGGSPTQAAIFAVRQRSVGEMASRARRLLTALGDMCQKPFDRGDWVQQTDRTLIRLPLGGRAIIYHASGAMRMVAGLAPMEALFERTGSREGFINLVEASAERLRLEEWVGPRESLRPERLWQIRAAAADRDGRVVDPVLCRIVGTYRHLVGELPVWGAASVAIKLAGGGVLDSISIQIREASEEAIDWAPVIPADMAARQVALQLTSLMGRGKVPYPQSVRRSTMHFGYLSLGKRSPQRVLAPHYVAFIEIEGDEAQGYQLIVPATEMTFLPLCQAGRQPPPAQARRTRPGQTIGTTRVGLR